MWFSLFSMTEPLSMVLASDLLLGPRSDCSDAHPAAANITGKTAAREILKSVSFTVTPFRTGLLPVAICRANVSMLERRVRITLRRQDSQRFLHLYGRREKKCVSLYDEALLINGKKIGESDVDPRSRFQLSFEAPHYRCGAALYYHARNLVASVLD
jgi:hypothetical protein